VEFLRSHLGKTKCTTVKFENNNILVISGQSWGENWVSKHHYSRVLGERGNQVYFLSPGSRQPLPANPIPNVTLLPTPRIPRGIRYLPKRLRKTLHQSLFSKLESQRGVKFDLVWSFDYSILYDFEFFAKRGSKVILHMADFVDRLPWREAAEGADICLGVTYKMVEDLKCVNRNSYFLNHGYANFPAKDHVFSTPAPNVVYAGNLTIPFMDRPRLLRLVESYPKVSFHFFGDTGDGNLSAGKNLALVEELRKLGNANVHGSVSPERLPGIFRQADALLLCYDHKFGDLVANSHKVMEYLASGKPVLSNWLDTYKNQQDLICMHRDEQKYCTSLQLLLQENDIDLAERRRRFALSHCYEKQVERVENFLNRTN
jgi:glycosyltransferase involved in cell wall biosynthesis